MIEKISIVLGILLFLAIYIYWQYAAIKKLKKQEGQPVSKDAREALHLEEGTHLLYFYSQSCAACKTMTPIIQDLEENRVENSDYTVHKLDVADSYLLARNFGVMATPTTIIVQNGDVKLIEVGAKKRQKLEGYLAC